MAKGQKRTSKEPKKQKDTDKDNKVKKLSGPKYLRQAESLSHGSMAALKIGQRN